MGYYSPINIKQMKPLLIAALMMTGCNSAKWQDLAERSATALDTCRTENMQLENLRWDVINRDDSIRKLNAEIVYQNAVIEKFKRELKP